MLTHSDGIGLHKMMANLDIPIVVLDQDAVVLDANHAAAQMLHTSESRMVRLKGGVIIDCERAKTEGGCGHAAACSACRLRNTITATFRDGQQRYGVVSEHPLGCLEGQAELLLHFSTAKVGETVVVTLEEREFVSGPASATASPFAGGAPVTPAPPPPA